jgi:hypothetical protein
MTSPQLNQVNIAIEHKLQFNYLTYLYKLNVQHDVKF